MSNFEERLLKAIRLCEGAYVEDKAQSFIRIYPFTTENISGYLPFFSLENKNVLTVGSSSDQAFELALKDTKEITILDICPFTKEYFYLKKAALINLPRNVFLKFFCYRDYPKVFKYNDEAFSKEIFTQLKNYLRLEDYESYLFWDELFETFSSMDIRSNIFDSDEESHQTLKNTLSYLKNDATYNEARKKLATLKPNFIIEDIFLENLTNTYDVILLSNIGKYTSIYKLHELFSKLMSNLNDFGQMLICYLYKTTKDSKYYSDYSEIYNLEKLFSIFPSTCSLKNFAGVDSFISKNNVKDAIFTYQKRR